MIKEEEFMYKTFGRLHVVGPIVSVELPNGKRNRKVWCECSCGNRKLIKISSLINGDTKSCGCLSRENHIRLGEGRKNGTIKSTGNYKHGGKGTRLYSMWSNMNNRCMYPSCDNYKWYGGRGIKVCPEWHRNNKYGFENFRAFAYTNGYDDTKEIDRKDSNGDYCPENCRFVSRITNTNNQSSCVNISYGGYTFTAEQWSRLLHANGSLIRKRISSGWNESEALTIPPIMTTVDTYKKQNGIKPFVFIDKTELGKIIEDENYSFNYSQNITPYYYNDYQNKYDFKK